MRAQLYHVTKTSNVGKIRKKGILPMQPTNWAQSGSRKRYGNIGEIFAFDSPADAIRWAAKWDWSLSQDLGSGKVSIVVFDTDLDDWEEDTADPLGQASNEGRWLKSHKSVKPKQILRADEVTFAAIRNLNQS